MIPFLDRRLRFGLSVHLAHTGLEWVHLLLQDLNQLVTTVSPNSGSLKFQKWTAPLSAILVGCCRQPISGHNSSGFARSCACTSRGSRSSSNALTCSCQHGDHHYYPLLTDLLTVVGIPTIQLVDAVGFLSVNVVTCSRNKRATQPCERARSGNFPSASFALDPNKQPSGSLNFSMRAFTNCVTVIKSNATKTSKRQRVEVLQMG